MALDAGTLQSELPGLLGPAGGGPARIDELERLKGGYSREMWSFTISVAGGPPRPWILCADSAQGVVGGNSLDRVQEAALLRHVRAAGVPAPEVLTAAADGNPLGVSWFVMERLPGTAAVGPLLRDRWYVQRRGELARQKARILAAIHATDPPEDVFGAAPDPGVVAELERRRWSDALRESEEARTATMDRALVWLSEPRHRPRPPRRTALVHGDYRTGNLLYDRSGIRSVLDWEMAHLGDPLEDVAWAQLVCWRLGTGLVGGLVGPDEWSDLYAASSGRAVDGASLRFWHVLTSVKMSILAWRAADRTAAGAERDLLFRLFDDLQRDLADLIG